ncbi:MAG: penicillin-binding protein activator [Magnetospirillum sp.]|nr:penicillin-binding protein activator [Magnetospirillum sp.]
MAGTKPPAQQSAARPQVQPPAAPSAVPPAQPEAPPAPGQAVAPGAILLPPAPAAPPASASPTRRKCAPPCWCRCRGRRPPSARPCPTPPSWPCSSLGDSRFNLIPLDTRGTADGAVTAAAQALAQGADILLGPLFSAEVKAAAPLAREHLVPMVAFTTDRSVLGNGVYTLGFLPDSQVTRVIGYARSQGRERFALLARSDDYGRAVADAFRAAVPAQGGRVVKVEYYDPHAADLSAAVRRLTDADARGRGKGKETNQATGPVPFDAVMIPDEGTRLRSLASLATYYDVNPEQASFLGTLLWDDPRLANEPSLQGGLYPAPPVAAHQDFEARYSRAFGQLPARLSGIASIAYDATALAAILARQPQGDYSTQSLTNPAGFAGVDGVFRLSPDGTSERGLAVRQITAAGPREVSPAPTSFAVPGQ